MWASPGEFSNKNSENYGAYQAHKKAQKIQSLRARKLDGDGHSYPTNS